MVPIKQENLSTGIEHMEVKVEEQSIEIDCLITVKQEIDNVEVKLDILPQPS